MIIIVEVASRDVVVLVVRRVVVLVDRGVVVEVVRGVVVVVVVVVSSLFPLKNPAIPLKNPFFFVVVSGATVVVGGKDWAAPYSPSE